MRPLRHALTLALALSATTCKEGTAPTTDELVQMVVDFCESNAPLFVAVQSAAGGDWVPVEGDAENSFTLNVPPTFGLVAVYAGGDAFEAEVLYVSREDVAFRDGLACEEEPARNRSISGSVPGLTGSQAADVSIYDSFAFLLPSDPPAFEIPNLPSVPLDLVATRYAGEAVDRIILRRNLGSTITSTPPLDFGASESFAPVTNAFSFSGGGTDFVGVEVFFHSSLETSHPLSATQTSPTAASFTSVPAAQTVAGDLQELRVTATNLDEFAARAVRMFYRAPADLTTTLGAHLPQPVVSFSGTPQRPRVQVTSQLEYGENVLAIISQGLKTVLLTKTNGYVEATPAVWDVEFPNLAGVAGFPGGGLTSGAGTDWFVSATNAPLSVLFGDVPEGQITKEAARFSFSSATSGSTPTSRLPRSRMLGARRVR